MQLNAGCELSFFAETPTPLILMLRPRSGAGQWIIREEYQITPAVNITEFTDMYGNLCQRVVAPEGPFSIHFSATVQTADLIDTAPGAPYTPVEELPDDVLHYTLPSRYCQSDQLGDLAAQITKNVESGYDQAEAIRKWIQETITYQYGTSNASTSAVDTAASRVGVCRDFTHLGISLCRALNIPARMVVGYLIPARPDGSSRLVRSVCRRTLVYVRCHASQTVGQSYYGSLWPRCRRCSVYNSVWTHDVK